MSYKQVATYSKHPEFKVAVQFSKSPTTKIFTSEPNEPQERDVPVKQKAPSGKQHDRLVSARREFGMSQDEFAKKAGVSKKDIADCESGKSTIPQMLWNKVDKTITSIRREKAKEAEIKTQKDPKSLLKKD